MSTPFKQNKPSKATFLWNDPFPFDEQLTEDDRMIRDTARAYARGKLPGGGRRSQDARS